MLRLVATRRLYDAGSSVTGSPSLTSAVAGAGPLAAEAPAPLDAPPESPPPPDWKPFNYDVSFASAAVMVIIRRTARVGA